jgi:hypothetical protein
MVDGLRVCERAKGRCKALLTVGADPNVPAGIENHKVLTALHIEAEELLVDESWSRRNNGFVSARALTHPLSTGFGLLASQSACWLWGQPVA